MPKAFTRNLLVAALVAACSHMAANWAPAAADDNAAAVGPKIRDVWYVYLSGDSRYGSVHIRVSQRDDGNYCYQADGRVLLDLLGQRQEITEKSQYVVTPKLQPVSVEVERKMQSGVTQVSGTVEGRRFVLTARSGALRRERSWNLDDHPLFDIVLDDWLAGQPATAGEAKCRLIDTNTLQLEDCQATRIDAEGATTIWELDQGPEVGNGRITLDAQGVRIETRWRVPRMHLRRATAAEARELTHYALRGREVLMFPIDQPVGPADRLTKVRVRLTWKDFPLDKLSLEDDRQRLVRHSQQGAQHEAILEIVAPNVVETGLTFPVEAQEARTYLGADRYILPRDGGIVRQARVWVGGETTALAAVRAISSGVLNYLNGGTLVAETLSAPEILQSKQGKCSEFSILFASAARSLGIPTRIALGMRMTGGSWVGHMWNEVYLGRWITVDSTAGEVGGGPTLLKLIDSDTVLGTQTARWELTETLDVAIEAFEPPLPKLAGAPKTGIDGPVYTNAEFACRITAPDPAWTLGESTQSTSATPVIRFKIPGRDEVLIHFVATSVPPIYTAGMLTGIRLARFQLMYTDFKVLRNEDYSVGGSRRRVVVFSRAGGKTEAGPMKTTEVLWCQGSTLFLVNLIADEAAHDEYVDKFFELVASFQPLVQEPSSP